MKEEVMSLVVCGITTINTYLIFQNSIENRFHQMEFGV